MFSINRLQSVLKAFPLRVFDDKVQEHRSDRYSKGFKSRDQLVAMVFGHLSGASSLRMIEAAYNSQKRHHYHLGTGQLRRSTLADANRKRSSEPFSAAAQALMSQVNRTIRQEGEDLLYLLDSSSISLKGPGFDGWTRDNQTRNTQGIKLHMLYEKSTEAPVFSQFSPANVNDITVGRELTIESGAVYVFDKGYCDFNWWSEIDQQGALFVTRFKKNTALKVEQSLPVAADSVVLSDELVRFSNKHPGARRRNLYTQLLRRVTVDRPGKKSPIILATNDLESAAELIAQRYKERWAIELYFKWIKQHLKIKTFFGRSENAVKIQLLCALIAYLLLVIHRKTSGFKGTLWALLGELRVTLFQRSATDKTSYERWREHQIERERLQMGLFA